MNLTYCNGYVRNSSKKLLTKTGNFATCFISPRGRSTPCSDNKTTALGRESKLRDSMPFHDKS